MFRALLIVCILLISVQANAQLQGKAKIDSLLAELQKAKGDTSEVNILSGLSFEYKLIDPDKGIKYGEQGLKLAMNINWKKGEVASYNSLASNNLVKSNYPKALEYWEKALKSIKNLGDKKRIAMILGNMGLVYSRLSDYPKALEYIGRALELDKEIGNKDGVVRHFANIGTIYQRQFDYPEALKHLTKALEISEEIGSKSRTADIFGSMGTIYGNRSDFPKALEYYRKALEIKEELGDRVGVAINLSSMGKVYLNQSDYPEALDYYSKSLKIYEELGNKAKITDLTGALGVIYFNQMDYPKALEYFEKTLKDYEKNGNKVGIATYLMNIANVQYSQNDTTKALEYYDKALIKYEEIGDEKGIANVIGNLSNLYLEKSNYSKALELNFRALKINKKFKDTRNVGLNFSNIGSCYLALSQDSINLNPIELNEYFSLNKEINLNKSVDYSSQAIEILEGIGEIRIRIDSWQTLMDAYELKGDFKKAFYAKKEHHKLKDSIFNQENADKIAALEKAREDDLKQKEIEKQKLKIAEQEKREQLILYFSIGFFIVMSIVMFIIYRLLKRSDKLLYNVLPVSIAKRLKKKEHPISDYFTQASIVFIDIVNFTEMAKDEDPRRVVEALNKIFTKYDTIANKYGLEKIKTIGDSYMAAAGIPEVQKDNTHRAAQMAIEVKELMEDYHTSDGTKIEVRIGLDCGPVVAGVIGENKFIYDMWSDAVNTASRMESSSESGQVHITERFKDAVSEFEEFSYVERGEIEIKGKGKMKTFYMGCKALETV